VKARGGGGGRTNEGMRGWKHFKINHRENREGLEEIFRALKIKAPQFDVK
jgi:hypothetical protein